MVVTELRSGQFDTFGCIGLDVLFPCGSGCETSDSVIHRYISRVYFTHRLEATYFLAVSPKASTLEMLFIGTTNAP